MTDLDTADVVQHGERLRAPKVRLRSPLGVWPVALPAAAIAAVVVATTAAMRSWPYQEWVRTSAEFHQQNTFTAPIAAAAATYVAGRLLPPSRIFALPVAARAGLRTVLPQLGLLLAAFVGAYLLGFVPLLVVTVRGAEHGGPDVPVVLTGVLGLVLATAVGYLIGVVTRTPLTAPISAVLLFGTAVLGSTGDTFSALMPVLYVKPLLGSVQSTPFVVYRLAFLTVSTVAVVWAAARLLRRHRADGGRVRGLTALLPLLLPVVMAVPPLVSKPALFAYETEPPRVCRTSGTVEYCVHEGHRSRLDVVVAATDAVLERHGGPAPFTRIYDEALRGHPVDGTPVWRPDRRDTVLWVPIQPASPTETRPVQALDVLSGLAGCFRLRVPADSPSVEIAQQLGRRLEGMSTAGNPFSGLPDPAVRDWIASHGDRITGCALTEEDLPRR
ncbi:hypothetical protein AB0I60_11745 [Actinosynnema sp. NPDC050436]|uniref:hypothetical protein n=1 Tax=Actinosynnema sp. NPDC050436 TaxID=3155659 RepID=UPI0033CFCCD1